MKVLLLASLACLVSANREPLQFSGNFSTIYLSSKIVSLTEENSEVRMLMREVKFFNNYTLMSMTFYVRINEKCQLHTLWANRSPYKYCFRTSHITLMECFIRSWTEYAIGVWVVRNANFHFPQHIYSYSPPHGGRTRRQSQFYILLHVVSNTTILLEAYFRNNLGKMQILIAALAKGKKITEEMWKDYVKLTYNYKIPLENIKNIYEADACPKWEQ